MALCGITTWQNFAEKTNDNNIPQLLGLSSKNVFSVIKQLRPPTFFVAFTIGTNN